MANSPLPCPTLLRLLYAYDPETGVITFRERPKWLYCTEVRDADGCEKAWRGKHFFGGRALASPLRGYLRGSVSWRGHHCYLFAHRVAWAIHFGCWPNGFIDHINGRKDDNRIANLREVSWTENARNTPKPSHNTSGAIGVRWHSLRKKWQAIITVDRRQRSLGLYHEFSDAVKARKVAEANLGFHVNHGRSA